MTNAPATTIDEIAPGIHRISTYVAEVPPAGFTFNQFLLAADEPLLFHTGPRGLYPLVGEALATVLDPASIRWISFGHVEADECGSMNMWLAGAPGAQVVHGMTGVSVSLEDLCDRPPRALADGEVLDLGGLRVRWIDTPHVPHGWEAGVLYEEVTGTLLCGDLLSQLGPAPAVTTDDVLAAALEAESIYQPSALAPTTGATLRRLGDLEPSLLAIMHGSSFRGDGRAALHALADAYEGMLVPS